MKKEEFDFYTYNDDRKCRYSKCQAPIADQEHATRQYCPREELPDGSVRNCKDDFWSDLKKEANTVYKEMELFHKLMEERLSGLYDLSLPEITLDIIESTGIELSKSLMHFSKEGISYFYFINYVVTFNLIDKRLKITKHEVELF